MKKTAYLAAALIALPFISTAQIEKNVGDFTSLKTTNRIKVELIPAPENKVVLKAGQEDAVNITNKNGRLILKNTLKELVSEGEFSVTVQVYFKSLNEIDAQGGSYIFGSETIKQEKLKLTANIGSVIDLQLATGSLDASANTGAKLKIKGSNSSYAKFLASAGAQIQAADFVTSKNKVTVNSGSSASVAATDFMEAQVIAGGTIKIYGNPKEVKEKTSIAGTIERIK